MDNIVHGHGMRMPPRSAVRPATRPYKVKKQVLKRSLSQDLGTSYEHKIKGEHHNLYLARYTRCIECGQLECTRRAPCMGRTETQA